MERLAQLITLAPDVAGAVLGQALGARFPPCCDALLGGGRYADGGGSGAAAPCAVCSDGCAAGARGGVCGAAAVAAFQRGFRDTLSRGMAIKVRRHTAMGGVHVCGGRQGGRPGIRADMEQAT